MVRLLVQVLLWVPYFRAIVTKKKRGLEEYIHTYRKETTRLFCFRERDFVSRNVLFVTPILSFISTTTITLIFHQISMQNNTTISRYANLIYVCKIGWDMTNFNCDHVACCCLKRSQQHDRLLFTFYTGGNHLSLLVFAFMQNPTYEHEN